VTLLVRSTGDPASLLGTVRDRVQAIDRGLPIRNTGTLQEASSRLWAPRMGAALLSIFRQPGAGLALIGVYGVMSYSAPSARRRSASAWRSGQHRDVLLMVLRQGLRLAVGGTAIGVVLAVLLASS